MKKKFFTEKRLELFIRFWSAGAVYFFLGWGTGLGLGSISDFIFVLGLVMAILEMFVINPVIRQMLNVKSDTSYLDTTILSKVKYRLLYIVKTTLIMILIAVIYNSINRLSILLFSLPPETVVLPGEPILFGILYVTIWTIFNSLVNNVKLKMKDVNDNDK